MTPVSFMTAAGAPRLAARGDNEPVATADALARSLVAARLKARALPEFPGRTPATLAAGYRIQEAAIALWPDRVAGWKIGRVPPRQVPLLGAERLAGPIFAQQVRRAEPGAETAFPVYEGGFAAVEAEIVFRIGRDAPADKTAWTREDAAGLIAAMHIGVETAGSPLAAINDLGAAVVVADFGNNHGLILGPEIAGWRAQLARGLPAQTFVEERLVGAGQARDDEDGPLEALTFLAGHLALRGKPLQAGQLVSTGAVTGVHDIRIGQRARVCFEGCGELRCAAAKAMPQAEAPA